MKTATLHWKPIEYFFVVAWNGFVHCPCFAVASELEMKSIGETNEAYITTLILPAYSTARRYVFFHIIVNTQFLILNKSKI